MEQILFEQELEKLLLERPNEERQKRNRYKRKVKSKKIESKKNILRGHWQKELKNKGEEDYYKVSSVCDGKLVVTIEPIQKILLKTDRILSHKKLREYFGEDYSFSFVRDKFYILSEVCKGDICTYEKLPNKYNFGPINVIGTKYLITLTLNATRAREKWYLEVKNPFIQEGVYDIEQVEPLFAMNGIDLSKLMEFYKEHESVFIQEYVPIKDKDFRNQRIFDKYNKMGNYFKKQYITPLRSTLKVELNKFKVDPEADDSLFSSKTDLFVDKEYKY